jgi:hypothetical protein
LLTKKNSNRVSFCARIDEVAIPSGLWRHVLVLRQGKKKHRLKSSKPCKYFISSPFSTKFSALLRGKLNTTLGCQYICRLVSTFVCDSVQILIRFSLFNFCIWPESQTSRHKAWIQRYDPNMPNCHLASFLLGC